MTMKKRQPFEGVYLLLKMVIFFIAISITQSLLDHDFNFRFEIQT